jgi:hypothetical protein
MSPQHEVEIYGEDEVVEVEYPAEYEPPENIKEVKRKEGIYERWRRIKALISPKTLN